MTAVQSYDILLGNKIYLIINPQSGRLGFYPHILDAFSGYENH